MAECSLICDFFCQISQEIIKLRKIGKGDLITYNFNKKVLPNEIIKKMLPYPFKSVAPIELWHHFSTRLEDMLSTSLKSPIMR
jgi:hypothetical protein